MTTRRLLIYTALDLLVWSAVVWLMLGDTRAARLSAWHHAGRLSGATARALGTVSLTCQQRYYELAGAL